MWFITWTEIKKKSAAVLLCMMVLVVDKRSIIPKNDSRYTLFNLLFSSSGLLHAP